MLHLVYLLIIFSVCGFFATLCIACAARSASCGKGKVFVLFPYCRWGAGVWRRTLFVFFFRAAIKVREPPFPSSWLRTLWVGGLRWGVISVMVCYPVSSIYVFFLTLNLPWWFATWFFVAQEDVHRFFFAKKLGCQGLLIRFFLFFRDSGYMGWRKNHLKTALPFSPNLYSILFMSVYSVFYLLHRGGHFSLWEMHC